MMHSVDLQDFVNCFPRMKKEIEAASVFLKNLVKRSHKLNSEQLDVFVEWLMDFLKRKFTGHWYPENPTKGQAFR